MREININDRLETVSRFPVEAECRTDLLPTSQVEVARRAFEHFLEGLSDLLPGYLFTPAEIRLVGVEQQRLSEALGQSESGSCTLLFAVQPFCQRMQLELGRDFAGAALQSVLGAPPEAAGVPRESLTEVDFHILRDLIGLVAEELRKAWQVTTGCSVKMLARELAPTLDSSPSDDQSVVLLTAEIAMGKSTGTIRLLVPSLLIRQISEPEMDPATGLSGQHTALVQALGAATFDVEAVLHGARIRVRDLLGLQPGKILQLPHRADAAIECQVNGLTKFRGELISSGKSLGFQVQS